jgi:hypothetical protein
MRWRFLQRECETDFLDPRAVIDRGQAEAARTHVKLNFFLVGVPAFEVGSNFVDQYWFVATSKPPGWSASWQSSLLQPIDVKPALREKPPAVDFHECV